MKKLYGITVAFVVPMDRKNQQVDYLKLKHLVKKLISKGIQCIYCCGTDSEMFHLTIDERKQIAKTVVDAANGEVIVYVHTDSLLYEDTLDLTRHAVEIHADGAGIITPAYYPLNEREMINYYEIISRNVPRDFPLYVYNIPQLAVNDLKPHTLQKIVDKCPNIVSIKYNYPDINQTLDYTNINGGNFSVLQGDDRVLTAWLALGCDGTVAGSANVFPEPLVAGYKAFKDGDMKTALCQAKIAAQFVDAMQNDNVAYFKAGLAIRGFDIGTMRHPLLEINAEEMKELRRKLESIAKENNISISL